MELIKLADPIRTWGDCALKSHRGEHLRPVKLLREALGTVNDLVGRPFCSAEELSARRGVKDAPRPAAAPREAAPVVVYFDAKDHRTLKKVEEILQGKSVPYRVLDVADDEATRSWALGAAKLPEFPLVFVAGEAVGGLHELTTLDVNGGLARRVFGA